MNAVMRAKFEIWCESEGLDDYVYGDGNYASETMQAHKAWKAGAKSAIQSLKVTPELRTIAEEAFRSSDGESWSGWLNDALNTFLSALKEQAK